MNNCLCICWIYAIYYTLYNVCIWLWCYVVANMINDHGVVLLHVHAAYTAYSTYICSFYSIYIAYDIMMLCVLQVYSIGSPPGTLTGPSTSIKTCTSTNPEKRWAARLLLSNHSFPLLKECNICFYLFKYYLISTTFNLALMTSHTFWHSQKAP